MFSNTPLLTKSGLVRTGTIPVVYQNALNALDTTETHVYVLKTMRWWSPEEIKRVGLIEVGNILDLDRYGFGNPFELDKVILHPTHG